MELPQTKAAEQIQRVQLELEPEGFEKRLRIRLENYDDSLGWYTSSSITLTLPQLALLEQAVQTMRSVAASTEPCQIIPFPGLPANEFNVEG